MKKITFFAVAIAAMVFSACGGNKSAQTAEETDSLKVFEQEQVEAKIKLELDSLAAEVGRLKNLPIVQTGESGVQLTAEEKQVKPDYLLAPSVAEDATTLAEKYRILSALSVDKSIAKLYEMPTDDYDAAINKLAADINDPSFKVLDDTSTIFETGQKLYDAMNENGRINYFWQIVASSLVEEIYVITQNTDKFITAFDDDSAANVTFRIVLLSDAVSRLANYDPEFEPVAKAIESLSPLNAISVDQLKAQLEEAKENIAEARANLLK
ncbi:MAG: hypothetical protein IKY01_05915 [Prevotella sp.]|nr:hypothetical protein [Prevotella sp.]